MCGTGRAVTGKFRALAARGKPNSETQSRLQSLRCHEKFVESTSLMCGPGGPYRLQNQAHGKPTTTSVQARGKWSKSYEQYVTLCLQLTCLSQFQSLH
jgi:hypothetical protein